jgi:hypothetical protein
MREYRKLRFSQWNPAAEADVQSCRRAVPVQIGETLTVALPLLSVLKNVEISVGSRDGVTKPGWKKDYSCGFRQSPLTTQLQPWQLGMKFLLSLGSNNWDMSTQRRQ